LFFAKVQALGLDIVSQAQVFNANIYRPLIEQWVMLCLESPGVTVPQIVELVDSLPDTRLQAMAVWAFCKHRTFEFQEAEIQPKAPSNEEAEGYLGLLLALATERQDECGFGLLQGLLPNIAEEEKESCFAELIAYTLYVRFRYTGTGRALMGAANLPLEIQERLQARREKIEVAVS